MLVIFRFTHSSKDQPSLLSSELQSTSSRQQNKYITPQPLERSSIHRLNAAKIQEGEAEGWSVLGCMGRHVLQYLLYSYSHLLDSSLDVSLLFYTLCSVVLRDNLKSLCSVVTVNFAIKRFTAVIHSQFKSRYSTFRSLGLCSIRSKE